MLLLAAGAAASSPGADGFVDGGLLEVQAETLVLGPAGSRRAGLDRAVLAAGKPGRLRLEVPLSADAAGRRDRVMLQVEVTCAVLPPAAGPAGAAPAGPAIRLEVSSTAVSQPSGEVVIRGGGGVLERPGSLFHDAFVSAATGERIVVNLAVAPWRPDPAVRPPPPEGPPRAVRYQVSIYRKTVTGLDFLGMPVLHSLVGRSVFYSFGFTLAGPEPGQITREEMRLEIQSVELRDDRLTGRATLEGVLRGTPVRASSGWSLQSGEEATLSLDLGAVGGEDLGALMVIATSF
jgi:hypothetical protein